MSAPMQIERLLRDLGPTPVDIAEALEARGIKGFVDDPFACPIANLIRSDIPGAATWATEDFAVTDEFIRTPNGKAHVSDAVRAFIDQFDSFEFIGLVEDEGVDE